MSEKYVKVKVKKENGAKKEPDWEPEAGKRPSGDSSSGSSVSRRIKKEENKSQIKPDPDAAGGHSTQSLLTQKEILIESKKIRDLEAKIANVKGLLDEVTVRMIDAKLRQEKMAEQRIERMNLLDETQERVNMKKETLKKMQKESQAMAKRAGDPNAEDGHLYLEKEMEQMVKEHIDTMRSVTSVLKIVSTSGFMGSDPTARLTFRSQESQTGLSVDEWQKLHPKSQDIRPPVKTPIAAKVTASKKS